MSGAVACALFVVSLVLFAGRVLLPPATGLSLNFLIVFITMAGAGVLALFAIALRRERGVASFATLLIGVLAGAFLVAEMFGQPGQPGAPSLGESDNGKTIKLVNGTQITLQLPGNPTTGYSWEASVSDPTVLRESSAPLFKPDSELAGAGGAYTFSYQATAPGRTELTLVYRRSWETGVAPLKRFELTIVVQ